jgi:hypothetical protein
MSSGLRNQATTRLFRRGLGSSSVAEAKLEPFLREAAKSEYAKLERPEAEIEGWI